MIRSIARNRFLRVSSARRSRTSSVTVVDDGTIPGLFGTSPFDDEGVPSRRTVVIENGVLQNYLLNTYTARKLGMKTTGNASRGLTGNAGVGHGNFYLKKGDTSPDDLIGSVSSGVLCHRTDRFRCKYSDWRLLARRCRVSGSRTVS